MKKLSLIIVMSILLMGCFTREVVVKSDVAILASVSPSLQNGIYIYKLVWIGSYTHVTYVENVASLQPLHYQVGQIKDVLVR